MSHPFIIARGFSSCPTPTPFMFSRSTGLSHVFGYLWAQGPKWGSKALSRVWTSASQLFWLSLVETLTKMFFLAFTLFWCVSLVFHKIGILSLEFVLLGEWDVTSWAHCLLPRSQAGWAPGGTAQGFGSGCGLHGALGKHSHTGKEEDVTQSRGGRPPERATNFFF